ncbi:MAG: winged helix-turn-helix transcriptional regulator [Nitrososphaerota archaeon]|nr:winged helix-turn-helix transcriptional regulator [Nitrososphaerota archaeon]
MQVLDQSKAMEVIRAFSDEYSRKIILSIINKSLPVEEISKEQNIPISTCYRRVHELSSFGIIKAERTILQEDGKKYVCYKSAFKSASVHLESGELTVEFVPNRDSTEMLHAIWSAVKSGVPEAEKNPVPLGDCDLCKAQGVPFKILSVGESNSALTVCQKCEMKIIEKKISTKQGVPPATAV